MKITQNREHRNCMRGFSLVELLVVVIMISIVLAAILTQVEQVQQRAAAEQGKVDDFQQARDFMAQVVHDARQMGYPNLHNIDTSATAPACGAWQTAAINDCGLAVGLVKLTLTELDFEADIDSSGTVYEVSYKMNGDGQCAQCMERAQVKKSLGNPLTQVTGIAASSYVQEVQNVQNSGSATAPIFSAYDGSGNAISLPRDITTDPTIVPTIRSIKINLAVANPKSIDPRTGKQLEADISGSVQVVNCSMATAGLAPLGYVQLTCQ